MNDTTIEQIAQALNGQPSGSGYIAHCPAHDDKRSSLSISQKNGKILLHCYAGCSQQSVIAALSDRGLWAGGNGRRPAEGQKKERPIPMVLPIDLARKLYNVTALRQKGAAAGWGVLNVEASGPYRDGEGNVVAFDARYDSPDSKTVISLWTADGKKLLSKNPPSLISSLDELAKRPDATILVVEGMKCLNAATSSLHEYIVLTWAGGSGRVASAPWETLKNRQIIIWPDLDPAGYKAAAAIRRRLPHAQILKIEDKLPGWDIYDAIQEGIDPAKFIAECPVLQPEEVAGTELIELFKPGNLNLLLQDTDAADPARIKQYSGFFFNNPELAYQLAAAFIYRDLNRSDIRLVRVGNVLHHYTDRGHRWRPLLDLTRPDMPFNEINFLLGTQRFVNIFGSDFKVTNKKGKVFSKHFNKSKTSEVRAFFIGYVLTNTPIDEELLLRRPGKTISTADGLLIFENDNYRLEPHRPGHGQTLPAFPYKYRPWDTVPEEEETLVIRYLTNLARAVPDEQIPKMVELLGFLIGYTLTPYRAKFFPVLIGPNDGGKTLFLELQQGLHSTTGTAVEVDLQQMQDKPTQFDSAQFINALVAINDDFPPSGKLPAQKLKGLVNPAKPMTINQKFKPPVTIINKCAPYISTNEDPQSDDTYLANRLLCVPFEATFNKAEQAAPKTIELVGKMHTPKMQQALFDFGVHCLQRFFREGTVEGYIPQIVEICTDQVAGRLNDVQAWLAESVEAGNLREISEGRAGRARLYRIYEGARKYPVRRSTFFTTLRQRFGREVKIQGVEHFRGLEVVENESYGGRYE